MVNVAIAYYIYLWITFTFSLAMTIWGWYIPNETGKILFGFFGLYVIMIFCMILFMSCVIVSECYNCCKHREDYGPV